MLPSQSDKEIQSLTQEREKTREHLESIDKSVTHLEAGVVIMLAVATLVVAVLFATIIFGEYRVNQAVTDLESKAREVKERFPMLATMETQARLAGKEIEVMFGAEDWLDDRYANLQIPERQQILTVEHLIAIGFTGPASAQELRGMANFYASKHKSESLPSDLDRSLYYALRAAERGGNRFQYLNDLGLIYTDLAGRDRQYLKSAIDSLEQSRKIQPEQQRCYYNLSVIYFGQAMEARNEGNRALFKKLLDKTRGLLTTALSYKKWELAESPELTSLVHYNMACCLCRLAEEDTVPAVFQSRLYEACTFLEHASGFRQTKPTTLETDLGEKGDLYLLASHPLFAQEIQKVVSNFERSWQR